NDMLGQVLRCVRGIDVSEDKVGIEVMKKVCLEGPGHSLGSEQTLELMQSEYIYPEIADRTSPKEWEENEKPDLLQKAIARKNEILENAQTPLIDLVTDQAIRERWKIAI
ncbi:MAG: trimethylamine methyltransferase family protein, partial [Pseudomonadota bacterium]